MNMPTKEEVEDKYITQNLTQVECAKYFQVTIKKFRLLLKKYNISKERGEVNKNISKGKSGRKSTQSSKHYQNAQKKSVAKRRSNTLRRLSGEGVTKEILIDEYLIKNYSLNEIAAKHSISKSKVRRLLNKFNITPKTPEQQRLAQKRNFDSFYGDPLKVKSTVEKTQDTIREKYGNNWYRNNASKVEKEIIEYIVNNYTSSSITPFLNVMSGDYSVIRNPHTKSPLQLDIYLPHLKLAFEYNGEYYHDRGAYENDLMSGEVLSREMVKVVECSKREITLIHLWEGEYKSNKREFYRAIDSIIIEHLQLIN